MKIFIKKIGIVVGRRGAGERGSKGAALMQ